jgi:hypothetical protein
MGVSSSEVGYTSATAGRGDHEVQDGHVVALEKREEFRLGFVRFVVGVSFVCLNLGQCSRLEILLSVSD